VSARLQANGERLIALDLYFPLTLLIRNKGSAFDKGPARIETSGPHFFLIFYILVILVSKQFASFLHISKK